MADFLQECFNDDGKCNDECSNSSRVHAHMTSAPRGIGGRPISEQKKRGCMDLALTRGGRGSKISIIWLTSFVHRPQDSHDLPHALQVHLGGLGEAALI